VEILKYCVLVALFQLITACVTSGIESIVKLIGVPNFAKPLVIHYLSMVDNIIVIDMLENVIRLDQRIHYLFSWYGSDSFEVD